MLIQYNNEIKKWVASYQNVWLACGILLSKVIDTAVESLINSKKKGTFPIV